MWSRLAVLVIILVFVVLGLYIWRKHEQKTEEHFKVHRGFNTRDIYKKSCPDLNYKRIVRDIEQIQNQEERANAYKNLEKQCSFENTVGRLKTVLQDRNDIFHMSRCLGSLTDVVIQEVIQASENPKVDFPIVVVPPFSSDTFQGVRDRVATELYTMADHTEEKRLYGPVYVLVYQTPVMRSVSNRKRKISYMNGNAKSYLYQPMHRAPPNTKLNYRVFLFFPGLSKSHANIVRSSKAIACRMRFTEKYKTKDELCFVRCAGEASHVYPSLCGCKSENGNKCLNNDDKISDYGILYKINASSPLLQNIFMNDAQKKNFAKHRRGPST